MRFEVLLEAERFIHNDLSNCAWSFQQLVHKKIEKGEHEGIYHFMLASLIFSAFSIEAKLNFVGWRYLADGWPERANWREKVNLLRKVLKLDLAWNERPLQTVGELFRLRDTIAHGKPEVVRRTEVVEEIPDAWEALRSQWERNISEHFVDRCREDEKMLWTRLLEAAGIPLDETLTWGGHSLERIIEDKK